MSDGTDSANQYPRDTSSASMRAMGVIIALPGEIAESLLDDDLAVRPLASRAEPIVVAAVVEMVGTLANLVTIAVAVPQVREMVERSLKWVSGKGSSEHRKGAADALTVQLSSGVTYTLTLDASDTQITDLVTKIISATAADSKGN